jgi:hypothetical protein
METLGNINQPKSALKYYCINCDYGSCKKFNYTAHLTSSKHSHNLIMETNGNSFKPKISQPQNQCENCCKEFKNRSGLWKHKKICNNEIFTNTEKDVDNLVQYLIKENADFKQLILDQNKQMLEMANKVGNNTNINSNNSNNTNNFNLHFFLNETCKNALNIMDFVGQLNLGIKDLEETGRLGFADGISKIFINGLKQLDISNRPLHCCDVKRETLYIKNDNQWNKEDNQKSILTNAIKHVAHKNIKKISEWTKEHPEFNDSSSKENDKYLKIVSEAMSGSTQEETDKNYNKIIKNIVKETIIDK